MPFIQGGAIFILATILLGSLIYYGFGIVLNKKPTDVDNVDTVPFNPNFKSSVSHQSLNNGDILG